MNLIAGNWKMNPVNISEATDLLIKIRKSIKNIKNVETVLCPPFVYLSNLKQTTGNKRLATGNLKIGSQNCFWEERGAFTGEISPLMLKNLGCEYVILGHSERRKYLKETNEMIAKKLIAAMRVGLKPILCIGETEDERKRKKTFKVLKTQLKESLSPVVRRQSPVVSLVIAYEPVWAIGTGNNCSPDEAKKNLIFIKKELKRYFQEKFIKNKGLYRKVFTFRYNKNNYDNLRFLYGGSAKDDNTKSYLEAGFDGLLLGGASLKSDELIKIVNITSEIKTKGRVGKKFF